MRKVTDALRAGSRRVATCSPNRWQMTSDGDFQMKPFPIAVCLIIACEVIACQGAAAQSSGCSAISNANDRLACYDKAAAVTGGSPDKGKTALSDPSAK